MWTFRAKHEDSLEIVQGWCAAGDGVVDVQAMLEARRRGHTLPEKPLASERKITYNACQHWDSEEWGMGGQGRNDEDNYRDGPLTDALSVADHPAPKSDEDPDGVEADRMQDASPGHAFLAAQASHGDSVELQLGYTKRRAEPAPFRKQTVLRLKPP